MQQTSNRHYRIYTRTLGVHEVAAQTKRDASLRHDALARQKYAKPFKWFKFNRARKATAK